MTCDNLGSDNFPYVDSKEGIAQSSSRNASSSELTTLNVRLKLKKQIKKSYMRQNFRVKNQALSAYRAPDKNFCNNNNNCQQHDVRIPLSETICRLKG